MPSSIPDLGLLVRKTGTQMNRIVENFSRPYQLSTAQFNVLVCLGGRPQMTASQQELARALGIKRSAAAILVQHLEKKGLVSQAVSPADRRQRILKLTSQAQALLPAVNQFIQTRQQHLLDNFSQADLLATVKVLKFMGEDYASKRKNS